MCGRFTLTSPDVEAVARSLAAEVERERAASYRPRWNLAPTDQHWIVRLESGRRRLVPARFGFAGAAGQPVINARAETAAALPRFQAAFAGGRCLVPADGFYEWQGGRGARRPSWFHRAGGGLLVFAGLCAPEGGGLAFVILTTAASGPVRDLHDRMPALLTPEDARAWLERPDPALLRPAPEGWLASREVSARVNAVTRDGPELLEAPAPEPQLKLL